MDECFCTLLKASDYPIGIRTPNFTISLRIGWTRADPDCRRRPPKRRSLFSSRIHYSNSQLPSNSAQESHRGHWTYQQEDQVLSQEISLFTTPTRIRHPRHGWKLRDSTPQTRRETEGTARDSEPNDAPQLGRFGRASTLGQTL